MNLSIADYASGISFEALSTCREYHISEHGIPTLVELKWFYSEPTTFLIR